jgi:predicted nucleotidyltransferase
MIERNYINELSQRIAQGFRPDRIILFGSYAYGKPTADSDVDLLVVLHFEGKAVRKAIEIRTRVNPGIPVDLMVRTPQQLNARIAKNDWLLREIVEKGVTLYEANYA